MFDIVLWILVGTLAGWIAAILRYRTSIRTITAELIIGMLGALLGGEALRFYVGPTGAEYALLGMLASGCGATILLTIFNAYAAKNNV